MEETIGYEGLLSSEEWDSLDIADWPDELPPGEAPTHSVAIMNPPGELEGNEERFELECDICEHIGAADTSEEADAIARLHEAFVATPVENWAVAR